MISNFTPRYTTIINLCICLEVMIMVTFGAIGKRHKGDNWGAFVICILNSKIKKIKSLTVKINDNNSISVMES